MTEKIFFDTLKKYWGYEAFRESQLEIITNISNSKDGLVVLSTGGGKSLCYQLPALISKGVCIVISPLISLMQDQVFSLRAKGIEADFLNSSLLPQEYKKTLFKLQKNQLKFLYLAPEQLKSERLKAILKNIKISRLVIDEAHCISEWGHDFRPEYKKIAQNIKSFFPNLQIVAFTATATKETQVEIINILELKNYFLSVSSFDRENLFLGFDRFFIPFSKFRKMLKIINESQKILIYCSSRNQTKELSEKLNKITKVATDYYNAGIGSEQRKEIQENFRTGKTKILVATTAFGMGIDISDIDSVIYWSFPSSIEEYYQGIGRAGRNTSIQAKTYLLYSNTDINYQKNLIKTNIPTKKTIKNIISDLQNNEKPINILNKYKISELIFNQIDINHSEETISTRLKENEKHRTQKFDSMIKLAKTKECKRKAILGYFGENIPEKCNNCSICNK